MEYTSIAIFIDICTMQVYWTALQLKVKFRDMYCRIVLIGLNLCPLKTTIYPPEDTETSEELHVPASSSSLSFSMPRPFSSSPSVKGSTLEFVFLLCIHNFG